VNSFCFEEGTPTKMIFFLKITTTDIFDVFYTFKESLMLIL